MSARPVKLWNEYQGSHDCYWTVCINEENVIIELAQFDSEELADEYYQKLKELIWIGLETFEE